MVSQDWNVGVGEVGGKWGLTANGYEVSFWGDENVLKSRCLLHNSVNMLKTTEFSTLNS